MDWGLWAGLQLFLGLAKRPKALGSTGMDVGLASGERVSLALQPHNQVQTEES